jgi:hypothetical protein
LFVDKGQAKIQGILKKLKFKVILGQKEETQMLMVN